MSNQKKWETEVGKVNSLAKFLGNGKLILLIGGVIITLTVILAYHYLFTNIAFDLTGIKKIILAILLGFGASASLTGVVASLMGHRVNVDVLKKAPTSADYQRVISEFLPKLEKAKEEMKHYLEISAVILVLTAVKDIIGYFVG